VRHVETTAGMGRGGIKENEGGVNSTMIYCKNFWIKKMWYLYTMEFYAAMKKNEMLSFASKWMELENIILSEVSLAQKTKNRMFSLICGH
jgi:hypothetical protein